MGLPVHTLNSNHSIRNILYSFISNGGIKYIGKTVQPLKDRMYGYENPGKSQSTNIRVNELIKKSLKQDEPIDIFILADNGLLSFGGFSLTRKPTAFGGGYVLLALPSRIAPLWFHISRFLERGQKRWLCAKSTLWVLGS